MKRSIFRHRVQFADCDSARIVFYPRYFEWFDRATEGLFRSVGLIWDRMFGVDGFAGVPLVDAGASFRNPARFGEELEIESWVDEWRGKVFVVRHHVTKPDPDGGERVTVAEGHEIRAWVYLDPDSPRGLRARRVPEDIKARFADGGEER